MISVQTRSVYTSHTHTPLLPNKHRFVKCTLYLCVCVVCLVYCCCSIQRCCCWFVICAKYTLTSHIHKHWRTFVFLVRYFIHVHSAYAHTYTPNTIVKLLIFLCAVCCVVYFCWQRWCVYVYSCMLCSLHALLLLSLKSKDTPSKYTHDAVHFPFVRDCVVSPASSIPLCSMYKMRNLETNKMLDCVFATLYVH